MPSTYSSNLKIELMSTGENSGTWGNITNTNLGTALEQAVVGYGAVSYASDANLTISITNSNAAQAARALVLNVTSAVSLTGTRELVVPTIEKQYIVQNNTTGSQSITVKTSAGTGITVPNGRKAHLYVDGTNVIQMFDFVDINGGTIDGTPIGGSSAAAGSFTTLGASGAATFNGAVTLGDAAADLIVFNGTVNSHLLFTDNTYDIGANGATRPRNLFLAGAATIGGNLSVGGTLTLTGGLILNGNVTVGDNASDTLTINSTITSNLLFTDNTYDIGASGATRPRNLFLAGNATIGGNQTLTGSLTVDSTTDSSSTLTGSIQTDGGLGVAKAAYIGTTLNIGGLTSGRVAYVTTSGRLTDSANLLYSGTDLTVYGITVGRGAGALAGNTVVGASALAATTTGLYNTAIGSNVLQKTTTGQANIAVGSSNAGGTPTMYENTTGSFNTALGSGALYANTTASNNTAVGYQAGYLNTVGTGNVYFGWLAGYAATSSTNTFIGTQSGYNNTTGERNTYIGNSAGFNATTGSNNTFIGLSATSASGAAITTGSKNTILGGYNGNQGGLDIRTASNYIVLSDGDGNPRQYYDGGTTNAWWMNAPVIIKNGAVPTPTTGATTSTSIGGSSGQITVGINGVSNGDYGTLLLQARKGDSSDPLTMAALNYGGIALRGASSQTAGVGITFPATQSASSNANTLDDYEEGDWTPVFIDVTYTPSTTYTAGNYTKIGRVVTVVGVITTDALDTTDASQVVIGGLPFTVAAQNEAYTPAAIFVEEGFNASGVNGYQALASPGTTNINMYTFTTQSTTNNYGPLLYNQLTNGSIGTRVRFQITYIT